MFVEVAIFIVISSFCNLVGFIRKKNGLTQRILITILFYSYGIASASTVFTSYFLALWSGNQILTDSISLCTGMFFAIELLLAVAIYSFYRKIR